MKTQTRDVSRRVRFGHLNKSSSRSATKCTQWMFLADFVGGLEFSHSLGPDRADQIVGGVVAQFGNVDPGSFSHRYPCDRFGNPIPLIQDRINLEVLKDVMDGVLVTSLGRMAI